MHRNNVAHSGAPMCALLCTCSFKSARMQFYKNKIMAKFDGILTEAMHYLCSIRSQVPAAKQSFLVFENLKLLDQFVH